MAAVDGDVGGWSTGLSRAEYGQHLYDLIFPDADRGRDRQTAQAHRVLWSAVVNRQLVPGARYFESDLAAMVGSSRVPVRNAVARMVDAGLLVRAGRGISVRRFSRRYVAELYDFRVMLESRAAESTAVDLDASAIADLRAGQLALRDTMQHDRTPFPMDFLIADLQMHTAIIRGARNRFLLDALTRIRGQLSLFQVDGSLSGADNRASLEEHLMMLAALARRDPDAARDAVVRHIRGARDRMLAASTYPFVETDRDD